MDRIIQISTNIVDSLVEEDKGTCDITDVTGYIIRNCDTLSPILLAFYIAMNAFTESKQEVVFDDRFLPMKEIDANACTGIVADSIEDGHPELDGSMWDMSSSIINLIKGNKDAR